MYINSEQIFVRHKKNKYKSEGKKMFKSEKAMVFVEFEHLKGTSSKTGKDYDIKTVKLSDGLEAIKIPFTDVLLSKMQMFKRGDKVDVTLESYEFFNNWQFRVCDLNKIS